MKIAFLDRDGTINEDYLDEVWENIEEPVILNDAILGLRELAKKGFKFIIITNQYIINSGVITEDQYFKFHNKLINILRSNRIEILETYYCPHTNEECCKCKKPKPGMIQESINKYPDIDLSNSIFIGDSTTDEKAALMMGIKFYGINGGDYSNAFNSILEIADYIDK